MYVHQPDSLKRAQILPQRSDSLCRVLVLRDFITPERKGNVLDDGKRKSKPVIYHLLLICLLCEDNYAKYTLPTIHKFHNGHTARIANYTINT